MNPRRRVLRSIGGIALMLGARGLRAETFPARAVHLVVGFSPGSGTDVVARLLAAGMQTDLGQAVVVDNYPGAGSTVAASRVARAAPDGYTIYLADFSHVIAASLYPSLSYDPVQDFAGISPVTEFQFVLVGSQRAGFTTVDQLLAAARAAPGKYSYGSSGVGSALHLITETFAKRTQTQFVHVPYRGGSEALNALLAGDIDFLFFTAPPILAYAKTGRLRILAVSGPSRDPTLPDVPTLGESHVGDFQASTWNVLLAPRATPAPVIDRLAQSVERAIRAPTFRDALANVGATPSLAKSPLDTSRFVADETSRWAPVVKASGASVT